MRVRAFTGVVSNRFQMFLTRLSIQFSRFGPGPIGTLCVGFKFRNRFLNKLFENVDRLSTETVPTVVNDACPQNNFFTSGKDWSRKVTTSFFFLSHHSLSSVVNGSCGNRHIHVYCFIFRKRMTAFLAVTSKTKLPKVRWVNGKREKVAFICHDQGELSTDSGSSLTDEALPTLFSSVVFRRFAFVSALRPWTGYRCSGYRLLHSYSVSESSQLFVSH